MRKLIFIFILFYSFSLSASQQWVNNGDTITLFISELNDTVTIYKSFDTNGTSETQPVTTIVQAFANISSACTIFVVGDTKTYTNWNGFTSMPDYNINIIGIYKNNQPKVTQSGANQSIVLSTNAKTYNIKKIDFDSCSNNDVYQMIYVNNNGTINVEECILRNNTVGQLYVTGFSSNSGGGTFKNNFVINNQIKAGVMFYVFGSGSDVPTTIIEHNTIVDNYDIGGSGFEGLLRINDVVNSLSMKNNIFENNVLLFGGNLVDSSTYSSGTLDITDNSNFGNTNGIGIEINRRDTSAYLIYYGIDTYPFMQSKSALQDTGSDLKNIGIANDVVENFLIYSNNTTETIAYIINDCSLDAETIAKVLLNSAYGLDKSGLIISENNLDTDNLTTIIDNGFTMEQAYYLFDNNNSDTTKINYVTYNIADSDVLIGRFVYNSFAPNISLFNGASFLLGDDLNFDYYGKKGANGVVIIISDTNTFDTITISDTFQTLDVLSIDLADSITITDTYYLKAKPLKLPLW